MQLTPSTTCRVKPHGRSQVAFRGVARVVLGVMRTVPEALLAVVRTVASVLQPCLLVRGMVLIPVIGCPIWMKLPVKSIGTTLRQEKPAGHDCDLRFLHTAGYLPAYCDDVETIYVVHLQIIFYNNINYGLQNDGLYFMTVYKMNGSSFSTCPNAFNKIYLVANATLQRTHN